MRCSRPRETHLDPQELVEYLWRNGIDVEGALEPVAASMLARDPQCRERVIAIYIEERERFRSKAAGGINAS
jgi:hypothetical protein